MKEGFLVRKGIKNIHVLVLLIFLLMKAEGFETECVEGDLIPCGWKTYDNGKCRWKKLDATNRFVVLQDVGVDEGYAILTNEFSPKDDLTHEGNICISFRNFVQYDGQRKFHVSVNDREPWLVDTTAESSRCFQYKNEASFKVTLNASCERMRPNSAIENLAVRNKPLVVMATPQPTSGNPTEIGDIQYVGVVVGAICIALFTLFSCLTIISARRSNQRDSRRQELQNGTCPEEDDRPDVVADSAPPSYDVVMASPNMYPPTPQGTPQGTPETTPYLSLHRRALLNQHGTPVSGSPQSPRQSMTPTIASQWEDELNDPPPPYPGIANGNIENSTSELNTRQDNHGAGTGESTSGESTWAESTSAESSSAVPQAVPRSSDLNRSDLSSEQDRENNLWVINRIGNNTREMNPRRNDVRDESDSSDASPDEFALRARTTGNVDGGNVEDEETQRASLTNETPVVEQNFTEQIVDNDIQYADSSVNVPKSSINNRSSTISNLALV